MENQNNLNVQSPQGWVWVGVVKVVWNDQN